MSDLRPSEEILNAFVDGEFSPEDRLSALKSIAANESLSREVCDLYQLKELVNMAYRADTLPAGGGRRVLHGGPPRGWVPALAAGVGALALTLVAVMEFTRDRDHDPVLLAENAELAAPVPVGLAADTSGARQILFHLTEMDVREAEALFDDIEHMFETAWLKGQDLRIQVVVHGTAMDLVRADLAPFPNRIRELVHTYPDLRVTACGQSRARLQRAERATIELLPWVEEVDSGVEEAARRQAEGWTYIRI
jgi:uncharacterized protein